DGSIMSRWRLASAFRCAGLQVDLQNGKTPSGENLTPICFSRSAYLDNVPRARRKSCARRTNDSGGFMERVKLKSTPKPVARLALFGPRLLIEGEDAATYDELLARMLAAVKPADVIEEMLIADVASLEWEVLRWRRLKTSLIRSRGLEA